MDHECENDLSTSNGLTAYRSYLALLLINPGVYFTVDGPVNVDAGLDVSDESEDPLESPAVELFKFVFQLVLLRVSSIASDTDLSEPEIRGLAMQLQWFRDFLTRLVSVLRLEYDMVSDTLSVFSEVQDQVPTRFMSSKRLEIPIVVNPQCYKVRLTNSLSKFTPRSVLQGWIEDYTTLVEKEFGGNLASPVLCSLDSDQSQALMQVFFRNLPDPISFDSSTSIPEDLPTPDEQQVPAVPLLESMSRAEDRLSMAHWPTPSLKWLLYRDFVHTCYTNLLSDSGAGMMDDTVHLVGASLDVPLPLIVLLKREAILHLSRMARSLDPSLNTSGVKPESERARIVRLMKISGIGIGVGVATAVTAGLAVPVVAAGLGAGAASLGIGGTAGLTAFLSTSVGSATVAGLVGAGSASLTGWRYGRRVGRLKVFRFVEIPHVPLLNSVYQRLDPVECRVLEERLYRRQDFFDKPAKKRKGWKLTSKGMKRKRSLDIISPPRSSASISDEDGPTYVHIGTIICVEGWIKRKGRLVTERPATPTVSGQDIQHFPSLSLDAADAALVDDSDLCSSEDPNRAIDFPYSVTPNVRSSLCSEDLTVSNEREPSADLVALPLTTDSTHDNEANSTHCRRTEQWVPLAEWATVFTLEWDPSLLENLGSHIYEIQTCFAVSMAQTWLTFSAAGHITTPLSWPLGLIQFANNLDNVWAMCMSRAEQASRALAAA
ncbi:MAG: hypothetical protein KVP17_001898, partial [Porospora cf. gigantea B]|uniref:uncharacterized protein n=2 Tax=Porospora cf. gigantea B TaxID=2853592 RepID=UPI003571C421